MKKTKLPKINHMLTGAYFNLSYKRHWQQAWVSKKKY